MDVISQMLHQVGFALFLALLGWAAVSDYREFLIPNRITLGIALLYPAHVLTSPAPVNWASAGAVALAVLAVMAVLWATGRVGGGDVKLLAATSLWAGPGLVLPFLIVTALTGGILAAACLARFHFRRGGPDVSLLREANVPYGIAIAAGGMFVAARLIAG